MRVFLRCIAFSSLAFIAVGCGLLPMLETGLEVDPDPSAPVSDLGLLPTETPFSSDVAMAEVVPTLSVYDNCLLRPDWRREITVNSGDSLQAIADEVGLHVNVVANANCIPPNIQFLNGMTINLPEADMVNPGGPPNYCIDYQEHEFFFGGPGNNSPFCTDEAAQTIDAVWQEFERHYVLYRSDLDYAYLMNKGEGLSGLLGVYPLEYHSDYDMGEPPTERYAPADEFINIFDDGYIRDVAGWAIAPAIRYSATVQRIVIPNATMVAAQWGPDFYITWPNDDRVLALGNRTWNVTQWTVSGVPVPLPEPTVVPTPVVPAHCTISPMDVPVLGIPGDGCHIANNTETGEIVTVNSLIAASTTVIPGNNTRVAWEITGAPFAILEVYDLSQVFNHDGDTPLSPLMLQTDLSVHESTEFTVPLEATDGIRIVVWGASYPEQQTTSVNLVARWAYRILDIPTSPTGAATLPPPPQPSATPVASDVIHTNGAFQSFENGFMIWRGDTGAVAVFINNGVYLEYPESSYTDLPDNPILDETPVERVKPVSGFGRVWGNFSAVRDALGWALATEYGYILTIESDDELMLSLPDGRRISVRSGAIWSFDES